MSDNVSHWLEQIGLEQYAAIFAENDIDWTLLPDLDNESLKDIGITSTGHRLRIIKAAKLLDSQLSIQGVSGAPVASEPSEDLNAEGAQTQAERRQLTVMFCDLVGSTALSQTLDPEALRELMQAYQQACGDVIAKYDGHVAQYLGDGLMTYFGWPRAYEDSAERAIRAALEVVEAVHQIADSEPLHVRLGIATGAVVVGETGAGDASVPKLAVGETPNLAARLQGLARADEIIISPDTRRLIGGTFSLNDMGEQVLKGIVEPVRAWRVTGLATTEGRFDAAHAEALTPLVGREEELGILQRRWALAQEGEGQVVLLSGEPGIGKSRLLNALREKFSSKDVNAMRFQCSPYYVNSAFWPSIHSFESALEFSRDEPPDAKLDKLESLIVQHYGQPLSDVRFVASLLSIRCDERYGKISMTPEKFKDETLRTLVDLIEVAAKKQPSVVLFEDAHWADPSTLEVLDLLIDRVKGMPLLIALTHRPEFQNRWADHGHVTALNLSKLTRAQSGALVSQVAGGKALPEDLLEQILVKTDGVPLFVEELTQSILESGEMTDQGDHYEYAGTGHQVTIPATLRDSLMARLDRFMPVKEIAQIGAAIGREFRYEMISAVAPLPTTQLDSALTQLTDSGLAFRRGTPPDAVYTFKHALVQDAAYDSLLKSRRAELHSKIASVIEEHFPTVKEHEPEVLAHHLTAAGELAAAIPLWQHAGEMARQRMALIEAIAHWNQGLANIEALPAFAERDAHELDLRLSLAKAWTAHKTWAAAEVWTSLRPALNLAKTLKRNDLLPRILAGLQGHIRTQGRVAEALKWAEEDLQHAEATGHKLALVSAYMRTATGLYQIGRLAEALTRFEHAQALLDADGDGQTIDDAVKHYFKGIVGNVASRTTWNLGYPDRAAQMWEDALVHVRQQFDPFHLGWYLTFGAEVFFCRGDAQILRQHAEECDRLGEEHSLPLLRTMQAPRALGQALILEGKTAEGMNLCKAGMLVWEATGGKLDVPTGKSVMAEVMAQCGDIDSALQLIDEAIEQVERPGWEERHGYAEILRIKGLILTLKNDVVGAENLYLASLECAREQRAKSWELRTATSLAKLWQSQGKYKAAYDLLAPVYNWFTEGFDTKDLKEAKSLLMELV